MRVLLLSLSLAIIFSSSCNGFTLPNISNVFNINANLPNLKNGLANAQTLGQATRAVLVFLRDSFDPSLDVNANYQALQQQYGPKLDAAYVFNLTPASVLNFVTSLVSLYQNNGNNGNNSNFLDSLINIVMQTGIVSTNMPTGLPTGSPTGSPTGPTPTMNPNPYGFLTNAFGTFAKNFFTNLLSSLQPGQLDSVIGNSTIQLLTPEVISALKAAIQVVNPTLYNAIKDINDPQTFYFLAQTYIKPYVVGYLNQIGSYFGIDINGILNPNGTQTTPAGTTVAPTDPYLDSLYRLLTELDAGKANLQMGTTLTKVIFLGSVLMKYPNVTAVWTERLRTSRPNVYQQLSSINDSATALIQLVPYLPELLNSDLQRIKSVYGVDFSYLLSTTYILSINPVVPTNPSSTSAGSTQPTATQTTPRPASTLPPTTPSGTPPPSTTQTTTRPASTLPPTTPSGTPPPSTTKTTTRPASTLPPTTPSGTPPPTTSTTTFNFFEAQFTTGNSTTRTTKITSPRSSAAQMG